jgi:hypothetical protein
MLHARRESVHGLARNACFPPIVASLMTTAALAQPFVDVAADVGLGDYVSSSGDFHGPGAVFADLNDDGYPDLYLVRAWGQSNRLYVNVPGQKGGRVFEELPDSGAGDPGDATGAIAGDYDNDGDLDLYVINFDQPNVLLQSQWAQTGQLLFTDVTAQTDATPGVEDDQHGVGMAYHDDVPLDNSLTAAWGDVDRDGDLDLYVGNHNGFFGTPDEEPYDLPGRRDVFYMNNGDGTFTDATAAYDVPGYVSSGGLHVTPNQHHSSSNAVIFADLDNDRWPDLLVTNKIGGPDDRDMLYRNLGADVDGTWLGFEQITYQLTPTFGNRSGGAMGVDVSDYDNDGDLDVYITDWSGLPPESPGKNDFWINQLVETGELGFVYSDEMPAKFSWGVQWIDVDLDGFQDLHVATELEWRDYLYMNSGGAGFTEDAVGLGVAQMRNARTSVAADYDRNGWPDLLVVNIDDGASVLYENRLHATHPERHFVSVRLIGDHERPMSPRSTRDAVGARASLWSDLDGSGTIGAQERQIREVVAGSSNAASTASLELEFGMRAATEGILRIDWPSGVRSDFYVTPDQFLVIDETRLRLGDLDGDGQTGFLDLGQLLAAWGTCPSPTQPCPADLDGNGSTGFGDLTSLLLNWGA